MKLLSSKTKIIFILAILFGVAIIVIFAIRRPSEKPAGEISVPAIPADPAAPAEEKTGFAAAKARVPDPTNGEQSDIKNEKSYALGIMIDSPNSADLDKIKNFVDALEKNIGKETLNAGTKNEKNVYYITDPTGQKANFETYYVITSGTDQPIADYMSENSTAINAAGSLLLGKDFPPGKVNERLGQMLTAGKDNQFLILNSAEPFPADWLSKFQTQ